MDNEDKNLEALVKDDNAVLKLIVDYPQLKSLIAWGISKSRPDLSVSQSRESLDSFLDQLSKPTKKEEESEILNILALKEVEAHLMKFLIEPYRNEPVEKIVDDYLKDETVPEAIFVTKISEHSKRPQRPEFYHDLVFKAKLPEGYGSGYAYIIIGVEPQNYKPDYPLKVRAQIYACDLFISENQWLEFSKTKELYKNAVPAYCIFLNTAPDENEDNTIRYYQTCCKQVRFNEEDRGTTSKIDEESLVNTIIVNVGPDYDKLGPGIFNFTGKILIKQSREEMESFLDQYHILKDRKERKMLLTGFEQANFDRGVEYGVKNSEKKLENFIEDNKDLDKDELLKKLKELKFGDDHQTD